MVLFDLTQIAIGSKTSTAGLTTRNTQNVEGTSINRAP